LGNSGEGGKTVGDLVGVSAGTPQSEPISTAATIENCKIAAEAREASSDGRAGGDRHRGCLIFTRGFTLHKRGEQKNVREDS